MLQCIGVWNYLEVAGSIAATDTNNNGHLVQLNTCNLSWLTELEQSIPEVKRKGFVRTPEFHMKHLKKAEGQINLNFMSITKKKKKEKKKKRVP